MTHGNRTCFYEASPEEKAYYKIKSVYAKSARIKAMTEIADPMHYRCTKPDMEVRYDNGPI